MRVFENRVLRRIYGPKRWSGANLDSVCVTDFSKSVTCFGTSQVPSSGGPHGCSHNAFEMVLCRTMKKITGPHVHTH